MSFRCCRYLRWVPCLAALLGIFSSHLSAAQGPLVTVQTTDATMADWDAARLASPDPARVEREDQRWRVVGESPAPTTDLALWRLGVEEKRVPLPEPLRGVALARPNPACLLVAGVQGADDSSRVVISSYNTLTDRWHVIDRIAVDPKASLVWQGGALLVHDGADASAPVKRHAVTSPSPEARPLDLVVIAIYLLAMLGIGLYFARGSGTGTAGYFLADRELNWFVGGVTLYATATSAISFVAVPAKAFATNWQYMASNYVTLLGTTIAAFLIIPVLRRMNLVSVYEYFETRFHPSVRAFSSGVTILYNVVGKQGVVILLPALVIQQMLGFSLIWSVVAIGMLTTIYTVIGGFRAVVWTDLVQCFIMLGGAAMGAWWICRAAGTDLPGMFHDATALGKTKMFSLDFSLVTPTLWAFLVLEIFNIITWPKDQMLMQRVFATRNEAHARGSVIFLAVLVIPGATIFFTIGTALFIFYRAHPDRFVPTIPTDSVFPMFIAAEMPAGLSGLLIAAILAASMSTLSSGISSLSTLTRVDFLDRFKVFSGVSARLSNRTLVFAYGLIATVSGILVSLINIGSLLDFGLQSFAILGGGFAAAYGLGLFTRSARWEGVLIGTGVSAVASFILVRHISPILMQATTIGISLVVGYVSSLIITRFRPLRAVSQ